MKVHCKQSEHHEKHAHGGTAWAWALHPSPERQRTLWFDGFPAGPRQQLDMVQCLRVP